METPNINDLISFGNELEALFENDRYISYNESRIIIDKYVYLSNQIRCSLPIFLLLVIFFRFGRALKYLRQVSKVKKFINNREIHNKLFIAREIHKQYKCENRQLDEQQIESIVSCEDANLVIAAAGSGKTLSLIAKANYLQDKLKIVGPDVLIISFTKKTVEDLKKRLMNLGVNSKPTTFHAFGNKILKETSGEIRKIITEDEISKFIKNKIKDLRTNDKEYSKIINDYLLYYQTVPVDLTEVDDVKELVAYNKSFLRRSMQSISMNMKDYNKDAPTFAGEFIKSKQEQIISNFLYINQVSYEYEKQYPYVSCKYKPDFTIGQYFEPIYFEHFGMVRRDREFPDVLKGKPDYLNQIEWKRSLHKQNQTILMESFGYMWSEGTLLKHIESELKRIGLKLCRRKEEEITELIDSAYNSDVKNFVETCTIFLNLYKSNLIDTDLIEENINKLANDYTKNRTVKFLQIFKKIYEDYEEYLKDENLRDFSDMIKLATNKLSELPESYYNYKYILVDEVQDLSKGRYLLLKSLLEMNPEAKLFCVGDDWQSIYRFAGSDPTLIQDFSKIFNRKTYTSKIEKIYRFGEPTVSVSSTFILKNPKQIGKVISPPPDSHTPIYYHLSDSNNDDTNAVKEIFEQLVLNHNIKELIENDKIHIIGRYNQDADRINSPEFTVLKTQTETTINWHQKGIKEPLKIPFITAHKAKGLTTGITILLNCNSGSMGFPATQISDPVLELLLAHPDDYLYSEERRLFYVAITRAELETHIISSKDNISPFVFEINKDVKSAIGPSCPQCKKGTLITKKGKYGNFTACSNFKWGCDYHSNQIVNNTQPHTQEY